MTSLITTVFEGNFIEQCFGNNFICTNCIFGTIALFFSLLVLIFNIFAFFKLTHFYRKLNFETNLILISIFQVIIIQLVIITLYELLIALFILIQIIIITLIIRKFVILSKKPVQLIKKNGLFLFLNTLNILLFFLYTMFLFKNNKDNSYSIILIHSLFYSLSSVILTFYSHSLVKLIKKCSQLTSSSSSQLSNDRNNSISLLSFNDIFNNNELFYSMRKKQIKPLYRINIICSFTEFLLILSILLFPYSNFKQSQFKIMADSPLGYIMFYIYIFICLFNVSANFLSFFWRIRDQYKEEFGKNGSNDQNKNRVIDNVYIKRETINLKNEEPKQVNDFIENDNTKKDIKKIEKSIYVSSFADISEEKDENYYVKQQNKEDKENTTNNLDNTKNKEQNNDEQPVNNQLLEPLNKNLLGRESIPYNLDSLAGINRNTTSSISKFEQDV